MQPDLIVLHYTAMPFAASLDRLCDPGPEVSAHWLIGGDGQTVQLVDETRRAWHAGAGEWAGVTDVNSRSIGVELANLGDHPFSAPQMDALATLLRGIMARWQIRPHRIIGHSDMAPARKTDPGPRFDWQRLARAGLSVWPTPATPGNFRTDARRFGYPDVSDDLLLSAFRMRFRPWASGPLDATDRTLMADLARRFPVDAAGPNA